MSTKPRKQVILAAYFPGVNNTTVWSDPRVAQPDRVRLVRPPRPDRRAGQARLLLPRRGPPAARAGRQDPRPRRRRPARHASRCSPRSPRSPPTSAWPARSTRRSTSPTSWPASWPPSTTCRAAARRGTSSPRRTRSPARTSAAAASSTTRTATSGPASSSRPPASCGTRGPTTSSSPTPTAGQFVRHGSPGAFDHRGPQFDIARPLHRAAQPAAAPGHPAGRRQRRRPRARRGDRRRHLQPAHSLPTGPGLLHRRQGSAGPLRPQPRRPQDHARRVVRARRHARRTPPSRPAIVRRQQFSPQTAILLLEQVWNRDLSAYDAEGPLPDIDPDVSTSSIIQGRARMYPDPLKTAADGGRSPRRRSSASAT